MLVFEPPGLELLDLRYTRHMIGRDCLETGRERHRSYWRE